VGCRNAIYTVRKIVDKLIDGSNTVSICAIYLTKAFDKVNHSSLYIKLMKRCIPLDLLVLLENWLSDSFACVKWSNSWSRVFKMTSGVRQGSVLPLFYLRYILIILLSYRVIELVHLLYYMRMIFYYWHHRSQHSRNCYGHVSRNFTL